VGVHDILAEYLGGSELRTHLRGLQLMSKGGLGSFVEGGDLGTCAAFLAVLPHHVHGGLVISDLRPRSACYFVGLCISLFES
jgi:hypothetical protein